MWHKKNKTQVRSLALYTYLLLKKFFAMYSMKPTSVKKTKIEKLPNQI